MPCRASACSTSVMKNSTSVAGIDEAMPFSTNTASRRRKQGSVSGARMSANMGKRAEGGRNTIGAQVSVTAVAAKMTTANT